MEYCPKCERILKSISSGVFECHYCNRRFDYTLILKAHIERKEALEKMLKKYPNDCGAWLELAYISFELKDLKKAEYWLDKVINNESFKKYHANAYYHKARLYSLKNIPMEAIQCLEQAIKLAPSVMKDALDELDFNNIRDFYDFQKLIQENDLFDRRDFYERNILKILSEHIPGIRKVVDINVETGYPKCPLCKKDLEIASNQYIICNNLDCAFLSDYLELSQYFRELLEENL